jgi:hypothetical protein
VTTSSPEPGRLLSDTHRLVFVGGLHRSGTTPLSRLLADHPEISGFHDTGVDEDEGQHLQTVYPPARVYGGAGRFALRPESHLVEDSPLATADNAAELLRQWEPWWDLSRPVLLEKSPPNLVMMRFLQRLYPTARFVVIVRHPIVVALSTKKWRRGTSLATMVHNWVAAHQLVLDDAPHVERLRVVNYEHLAQDPAPVLAELSDFLELQAPLSPDLWQSSRSRTYEEWWERLRSSRMPWRRTRVQRLIENYEPQVNALGYSLLDLDRVDPFPVRT